MEIVDYYVKRLKREIDLGIIVEKDVLFTLQCVYRVSIPVRDSVMKTFFPDYEPVKPKIRKLTEEEKEVLKLFNFSFDNEEDYA